MWGNGGPLPKKMDSDENFKPEHTLFCRELRFVVISALFRGLVAKKSAFLGQKVFLGQEVHYYVVCIAYFIELNLQICDYAQKRRIRRENCKYAFDGNFHGHFCPRRKAAKFCYPASSSSSISSARSSFSWLPVPSRLQRGVDMAPQFTHSRPSPK